MSQQYIDFVTSTHSLYDRYEEEWKLCVRSFYSGPEYKNARYLRAYQVDFDTPGELLNIYTREADGSVTAKHRAKVEVGHTSQETTHGGDFLEGSFYGEKLEATPIYNYVKLIVSEYNSILFRNPPQRYLGESEEIEQFLHDVDGEENSLSEFMSQVDMYATIFGVVHIGCYKPIGSNIPKFKIHTPLDVTNWSYRYDINGNLVLDQVVVELEKNDMHSVYRVMNAEFIDTVFVGVEEDYIPPVDGGGLTKLSDTVYRYRQPNELGYPPITTVYQNIKVYNNIGSTVVFDVAGIQRSIYGYASEQYQAVTYGSHPTLVIDAETDALNGGQIQAEPGAIIRVQGGLTGDNKNYVYEFVSPDLSALTHIQELIDNQVQKLSQIAMLRSEDLIKNSRSGEQIEVYDDKLASLIRKKATNLENAEYKMFAQWFDWLNMPMPEDFKVTYSRQYNKRALETELKEIELMMNVFDRYQSSVKKSDSSEEYATADEAIARAEQLGGTGYHSHIEEDGSEVFMPFATHEQYQLAISADMQEYDEEKEFKESVRNKIRDRLKELLDSSSTNNGL